MHVVGCDGAAITDVVAVVEVVVAGTETTEDVVVVVGVVDVDTGEQVISEHPQYEHIRQPPFPRKYTTARSTRMAARTEKIRPGKMLPRNQ